MMDCRKVEDTSGQSTSDTASRAARLARMKSRGGTAKTKIPIVRPGHDASEWTRRGEERTEQVQSKCTSRKVTKLVQ